MINLDICLDLDQIKEAPITQFQKLIDESIEEKSFIYLMKMKNKNEKGKVAHVNYEKNDMQEYLKCTEVSIQMKKIIVTLICRMLDIS